MTGHTPPHRLETRKRRVYVAAALIGVGVLVVSITARDADDVVLAVVYPILAGILAAFALAVHRRRVPLVLLERLLLAVLDAAVLGRLAWHLLSGDPIGDRLLVLVGGHYWAVGAIVVVAFGLLDRRTAIVHGTGVIVASLALVTVGVGGDLVGPGADRTALLYLVRVHGFLVLLLTLAAGVTVLRDELQRSTARAEALAELARTDPLTGLANRRAGVDLLTRELVAASRYGHPLSVILADLDHFKAVNDHHGYEQGDRVLVEVAARLRSLTRGTDLVARWGGEEILIVAPYTDHEAAVELAGRSRDAIVGAPVAGLLVTATFGVAGYEPGDDVDALLRRADGRLYAGKQGGRDRVVSTG